MEATELKKLQKKFVAMIMASVFVVLTIVFAAILVTDFQQSEATVYNALDSAISQAGSDQKNNAPGDVPEKPEGMVSELGPQQQDVEGTNPPEIGGQGGGNLTPVAVYSIADGGTLTVDSKSTTASISDDVLDAATDEVVSLDDGQGTLTSANLYYMKKVLGNTTYVAFADKSSASSWQSLAVTLAVTEVVALAAFFVISLIFAKWAVRPVEKAWQQQQQFIADASHELKTPLTVILANNSLIRKHPEKTIAQESDLVESTQTEAERMQELVCEMLDLMKTGQKQEALERLNFSDLVEGRTLQFEAVAFEKQVSIESDIAENIEVNGNEARLNRLVSILLDNACKYSPKDETVQVNLKRVGERAELTVNNKGAAIPAEDLEHIFDRFYRADKARTAESGSYGLGLAIAKQIAYDHSGTITCTSTATTGTTFTVTI